MKRVSIVSAGLLVFISGQQVIFHSNGFALAQTVVSVLSSANVPSFKDYLAPSRYHGPPAKLRFDSEFSRFYRTRLTEAMMSKPTIAGEYVVAGWGCGSGGCYVQSLVNKRTGKAIETGFQAYNRIIDLDKGLEERVGEEIKEMRIDSRLLVTRKVTEEEPRQYFNKYYVVDHDKLRLIKKVQLPKPDGTSLK
jgi:hypothetical protein